MLAPNRRCRRRSYRWPAIVLVGCFATSACGGDDGDESDESAALFAPERVIEVEIDVPEADWDALREQTRSFEILLGADCQAEPFGSPFTYFQADVTIDGQFIERVGLRKKGFLGSLSDIKPSLKIKFDEFVEGQELYGYERLTLNNNRQDASHVKQCFAYQFFAAAGIPSPRCNFAHVTVNGEDMGVFSNVESVKKEFLRRHFDDEDGMLFEGTLSDFRDGWDGTFEPKTNTLEPDFSAIDAVVDIVAGSNDTEFAGDLAELVEVEDFVGYWVAELLVGQGDGYANNTNNYFLYGDPDTGRLNFIPWGVDGTFNRIEVPAMVGGPPRSVYLNASLPKRLYAIPDGRTMYFDKLTEFLDTLWDETALIAELDRMEELIAPLVAGDPITGERDLTADVERVRDFVSARRDDLASEIADPPEYEQPLRDSFCFEQIGSLSASFDTTFGTITEDNAFATGTGTLAGTIDEQSIAPLMVGSKSGVDQESSDRAQVQLVAQVDATPGSERFLLVAFSLSRLEFGVGSFDIPPLGAFVLEVIPATNTVRIIGFLSGGTITLTQAGQGNGDPVVGTITADVYDSPF